MDAKCSYKTITEESIDFFTSYKDDVQDFIGTTLAKDET